MPGLLAQAMALEGKRVRLTTATGETWEGRLTAISSSPTFLLSSDDGSQLPPFSMTLVESIEEVELDGDSGAPS